MTARRRKHRQQQARRIYVRSQRRDPPDPIRLSKALLARAYEMEQAQAEADAARQGDASRQRSTSDTDPEDVDVHS